MVKDDKKYWCFSWLLLFSVLVIWLQWYLLLLGNLLILDYFYIRFFQWSKTDKLLEFISELSIYIKLVLLVIVIYIAANFVRIFIFDVYEVSSNDSNSTLVIGDKVFVNKLSYGPRLPISPLSIPLVFNNFPFTKQFSYINRTVDYKRLWGTGDIDNGDLVVFNHPFKDSVFSKYRGEYYKNVKRKYPRNSKSVEMFGEVRSVPIDRIEYHFSRCFGTPGDRIEISNGRIFLNDLEVDEPEFVRYDYLVRIEKGYIDYLRFGKIGIKKEDVTTVIKNVYNIRMTIKSAELLQRFSHVTNVQCRLKIKDEGEKYIYPVGYTKDWNTDNIGPIIVPQKGQTISLNPKTLPFYKTIINKFEGNSVYVKGNVVILNGVAKDVYTFKKDYYYVINDNRTSIDDSRYIGFIPEDYIIGTAECVLFSNNSESFKWRRILSFI